MGKDITATWVDKQIAIPVESWMLHLHTVNLEFAGSVFCGVCALLQCFDCCHLLYRVLDHQHGPCSPLCQNNIVTINTGNAFLLLLSNSKVFFPAK